MRVAAVVVGVVLLAVLVGVVAALLATPGRVFLVATLMTAAVAFVGGLAVEPFLRRWVVMRRRGGQVELEGGRRSWRCLSPRPAHRAATPPPPAM